jgi:serine/threonine protein kinase
MGFFMDYVDGGNVRDRASSLESPLQVASVLLAIADTVRYAHSKNVLHRDIKPENIILTESQSGPTPYLTDFDLAWFPTATQVTKAESSIGTLCYAAPEQLTVRNNSHIIRKPTVDIYAFGQLAYFAAAGVDPAPVGLSNNARSLQRRLNAWPNSEAAAAFHKLYVDCTRERPEDRLPTMTDVVDRLGRIVGLLRLADQNAPLTRDQFLSELAFSIVGLQGEGRPEFFVSNSGRTRISIEIGGMSDSDPELTARINLEELLVQGSSNEEVRKSLNKRIDSALEGFNGVRRRPGSQGAFETFVVFNKVELKPSGIDYVRAILVRMIDIVERA